MSASLSKSLTGSPSSHFMKKNIMEHEASKAIAEKQGIVTILGPSDSERTKAASLRRTLSADMSSKRWLAQHGFFPMKKIASSEELSASIDTQDNISSSSSSEDEDRYQERKGKFLIWSSLDEEDQKKKMSKAEAEKKQQGQLDLWSSIICQKANEEANKAVDTAAPYVHPLVKKQSSSLTVKSLEVCTESLGSETGSEGFSSYPPSETGDIEVLDKEQEEDRVEVPRQQEEEKEKVPVAQAFDGEEFRVVKYNSAASKKLPPTRSFPPPLPSLSGCDGTSVRMRTHRNNGRVVLEAVSMPSPNNFRAQRQNGRLVLTFLATTPSSCEEPESEEVVDKAEQSREEDFEENFVNFQEGGEEKESEKSDDDDDDDDDDDGDDEEEEKATKENGIKEIEIVMEEAPKVLTSRVTNVHRLALMMNKPIGFANKTHGWANKTHGWANKFNEVVKYGGDDEEVEVEKPTPLAKSLPPRPGRVARLIPKPPAAAKTAAAAGSFNAYEYYWRTKPTATAALNPLPQATSQSLKSNGFMSKNQVANEQQQLVVLRGNKGDHLAPFSKGCKEPRRSLLFWEPYCIATS